MAYDSAVADRLRKLLADRGDVIEKKMFGGIAFMLSGNMCCGVVDDMLMARVGPDRYRAALDHEHTREMDFAGRPLTGFVYVLPEGIESDDALADWVGRCVEFAASLPAK